VSKRQGLDQLILAFERQEVALLRDDALIHELLAYSAKTLPSGLIQYGAPPQQPRRSGDGAHTGLGRLPLCAHTRAAARAATSLWLVSEAFSAMSSTANGDDEGAAVSGSRPPGRLRVSRGVIILVVVGGGKRVSRMSSERAALMAASGMADARKEGVRAVQCGHQCDRRRNTIGSAALP
jgi:hypothetical protein